MSDLKMAARRSQRREQNIIFLIHHFLKALIQAEGGLWVSLICVCDVQEKSSFQMPRGRRLLRGLFFRQALITEQFRPNSETCYSFSRYCARSSELHRDPLREGARSRMTL